MRTAGLARAGYTISGFRILGLRIWGVGFMVWVSGLHEQVRGFGLLGLRVLSFRVWVSGLRALWFRFDKFLGLGLWG